MQHLVFTSLELMGTFFTSLIGTPATRPLVVLGLTRYFAGSNGKNGHRGPTSLPLQGLMGSSFTGRDTEATPSLPKESHFIMFLTHSSHFAAPLSFGARDLYLAH